MAETPTQGSGNGANAFVWSALSGANRSFIEDLYARWVDSPSSVDASWRELFEAMPQEDRAGLSRENIVGPAPHRRSIFGGQAAATVATRAEHSHKNAAVLQLISAYRRSGHLVASLDPLGLRERRHLPQLTLAYHGLSEADLDTVFHGGRLAGANKAKLREIIAQCEKTYCGPVGAEFMYIRGERRRRWLERRIEESASRIELDRPTALRILDKLAGADHFEQFMHTKYIGAKRFSVEGSEAIIPMLDILLNTASQLGVKETVIGMAHRGRLNVLANVLGKAHRDIFEEFEDAFERPEDMGSGDVKYHLGFSSDVDYPDGSSMHLTLAFNPSHLEFVGPVVEGQVRGKQDHYGDVEHKDALSVIIHGDAAIAGQGVVPETINMGRLDGYHNGGTIHVVINNQIGFTTPPRSSRSSEHCTDIVKVLLLPVLHVNADDLGAVAFVARLAAEYRQQFGQDIVIDLWSYRKYGHNEGDEPEFTNPAMVRAIRRRKTPLQSFVDQARASGVIDDEDVQESTKRIRAHLDGELSRARDQRPRSGELYGLWKGLHASLDPAAMDYPTRFDGDQLRALGTALTQLPEAFEPHRKVKRILKQRAEMAAGERDIDWAMGEALAFASLLAEGHPIRLSGQDSGRGTFSHRHSVLHDQSTEARWISLNHLGVEQARFEVYDSPLSEAAVLGFEFGYTLVRPEALVIWEAQFGDFANGAQVLIDQFVCSSEAKWNRCSGLVMYLPHGYEGQGPEHSSARLERFLQLSGNDNWRVMNLTTPAQLFHALRSQLHCSYRKPLVIMTPKSLLRHPEATSTLDDLADGYFLPILEDPSADPDRVRRIVLCSGKVYYDLIAAREASGEDRLAILRVEQLYPFREDVLAEELACYPEAEEIYWCQEEPRNMGAWSFVAPLIHELSELPLRYVGRDRAASPATGSKHLHDQEQKALVLSATEIA